VNIDILMYVDSGIFDNDLDCFGSFTPDSHAERLSAIEAIRNIIYSIPESYTGILQKRDNARVRAGDDDVEFWKELFSFTGADHIIKITADSPFMDSAVVADMVALHCDYLAEFTFSENLPAGLSCEIVSRELVESIPAFNEKTLPLSGVVKSNINQFDIELYYKDPDIRDKRISFLSRSPRDRVIMENIHELNSGVPDYSSLRALIDKNPAVLYAGPSYLEIELTGECDLECIFCYRKLLGEQHSHMPLPVLDKILSDSKKFKLPFTVALGGSGEPLMHPNFYAVMDRILASDSVESIIIETNGVYADTNFRNFLKEKDLSRIKAIFNINGMNRETYTTLHGADRFDSVYENITALREMCADTASLYLQVMKINETEPWLDSYYDFWEKQEIPIVLQKQNTFLGRIQDRRYSDLSPLERGPCWHLQRDMYILSNGDVAFCRQDIDGKYPAGNVMDNSLVNIWESGKDRFLSDYHQQYPSSPDCRSCDEWYTFNF